MNFKSLFWHSYYYGLFIFVYGALCMYIGTVDSVNFVLNIFNGEIFFIYIILIVPLRIAVCKKLRKHEYSVD